MVLEQQHKLRCFDFVNSDKKLVGIGLTLGDVSTKPWSKLPNTPTAPLRKDEYLFRHHPPQLSTWFILFSHQCRPPAEQQQHKRFNARQQLDVPWPQTALLSLSLARVLALCLVRADESAYPLLVEIPSNYAKSRFSQFCVSRPPGFESPHVYDID